MKAAIVSIAFMAAIGFASPLFAQYGSQYSASVTGGGSPGYNHGLRYYRLGKHRHGKLHAQVKPQASKPSGGGAPAAGGGNPGGGQGAGGEVAKQPMGRP